MKYTKIALLMVIPALVLLLLGGSMRPQAAQARVSKILTITDAMCTTLAGNVDWNANGMLDVNDPTVGFNTCKDLGSEDNFRTLTRVLQELPVGGDTSHPEPEDFAKIDMDAGQLHQDDQIMWVVAFVGGDDPMGFYADEGVFKASGKSSVTCGPFSDPTALIHDEDCDGDGIRGDGVVAVALEAKGADRGPAEVRVRQGHIEESEPYKIVGETDHISIKSIDAAIQTGAPVCELFSDTASFLAIDGEAETGVLVATVTDVDETPISGAMVAWSVDDDNLASLVIPAPLTVPFSPTLDLQALGIGAPEVICGGNSAGTVKVTATLTNGVVEAGAGLDPSSVSRHASIEVPVQSAPEKMTLSADPASLVCDGAASSTVTATLTDGDGKPVVNGNLVEFSVKALGVANPIRGRSATGVATSVITPLAGLTNGVVVHATLMRHVVKGGEIPPTPGPPKVTEPVPLEFVSSGLEQTMLVNCEQAAPAAPEAPPAVLPGGAPAGTVISPPLTGDGGSHAPSAWLALPLGGVALLLMGSGFALRRRLR